MPPRARILLLLLAPLVLGGCMKVGPDFRKPEASAPPAWMEAERKTATADLPVADDWWKLLSDPALDELTTMARARNIPLHIAGVRILQARAQLGVSVGRLFPQTQQAQGGYSFTEASQRAPTSPQPPNDSGVQLGFWQNNAGFSAAWELDFWGKYRRAVESAEATLAASVADYDNALASLTADVASTYVLLRVSEEQLRIARENVVLQTEALDIADVRFRLGATSERDVMQAKTLLESTLATIPVLEKNIQKGRHALSALLGMPPSDLAAVLNKTSSIPRAPDQVGVGIPAELLRRRPDIRAAEFRAAAQCASIGVAKADLFPSFSLTGNVGWLSSNMGVFSLAELLAPQSFTAGFGPSFTWNLFNYGRIVNNVRLQDAKFQEALLLYSNAVITALKEAEDGLSEFQQSRVKAGRLALAAEAAKRGAELAFLQYREGKTDFTTVIVAQQDQLTQQNAWAQARGEIVLGLTGLYRALGGGWQERPEPAVPKDIQDEMKRRTWWGSLLGESPAKQDDPAKAGPGRYVPDF
ncbi:Outer membrane protein OprM [Fundidesulfovibrio magnetotacticus]|uniref:Outer membrane protein OprM n=1 Tax=Fundidesulfovibrio magnetotacticus TaxID=2730080 RepID=A0A6V8LRK8_9BACT|nr:efflux transporter outer membrane subunit [Fundidesulfovibrio magnetotacticus]GFK93191.1 Outer membrane protein OprM [Fundidesulfovibrio magnetotacticus]